MDIEISDDDINNWIELAQTNETMRAKLLECATIYALALPEHNTVNKSNSHSMFKSEWEEAERLERLKNVRYGL